MSQSSKFDHWAAGDAYENYMGQWSRRIARDFLNWLAPSPNAAWLDVGCGTGALTESILELSQPKSVLGVDPSETFIEFAKENSTDHRASFTVGGADRLPVETGSLDIVTSGLAVNFFPDVVAGLVEMKRVLKPGGCLCFYVWDYPGGGMGFIDAFWKAAISIDVQATPLDEATRFPQCTPGGLTELCASVGLKCEVAPMEREAHFSDFDVFWEPFTRGAGPAPGYLSGLDEEKRGLLKSKLRSIVGKKNITLVTRAWATKSFIQ